MYTQGGERALLHAIRGHIEQSEPAEALGGKLSSEVCLFMELDILIIELRLYLQLNMTAGLSTT